MMRLLGIVMTAAALVAAGCGSDVGATTASTPSASAGEPSAGGGSPVGKTYLSVAVTEAGKDRPLASDHRIRLMFRDGALSAWAGCNHLSGMVTTAGGTLTFDTIVGTDIGCRPAWQAQDEWLEKLLLDRPTWKLEGDVLTITRASTTLVLKDREIVEPDLPLEGTKWLVDTVVAGPALDHFPDAESAYFTLTGNQATGSTGCNTFTGPVTHTGNTLSFGRLTVTTAACTGDPARLERAVIGNLSGKLTYKLDSNCLELRTPDNKAGLNLTSPTHPTRTPIGNCFG